MIRNATVSHADAAWLHMDRPTNRMVINSVLWFDRPLDWARAQAVCEERLLDRFPRFRQRVRSRLPGESAVWQEDENFDPALHFHRLALPAPGDREALRLVVSDLASSPLDPDRPLWDMYLLEGYGDGCAVLVRMHHAIADGVALARVMLSLTDVDGRPLPSAGLREPEAPGRLAPLGAVAGAGRAVVHEALETVVHPRHAAALARSAAGDARTLAKLLLPDADPPTALKGDSHVAHSVAWSDPVLLRTVKALGHATGTTVNDVLVSAVAGAIGEYLRSGGDATDEVHALVPFNLRPLDEPLPRDLGNRFGLILLELPVGMEEPFERLRAVHTAMAEIKASHEGAISYGIIELLGALPGSVEERLIDFFSAKGTMVLTNVPGPPRTVSFAGAPVRGVLVWAPCSGSVGMSVSIFSYAGKVTVGFLTDTGLVPDPQVLADGFRRQLRGLRRAVTRRGIEL
jgi:WS/DGAT/MGAT family acyltransferase